MDQSSYCLDQNRMMNLIRAALTRDPRYALVIVPAAARCAKPWELFAYWLVHSGEFPQNAAIVPSRTWDFFLELARSCALDGSSNDDRMKKLLGDAPALQRCAAIGQWPKALPGRKDTVAVRIFLDPIRPVSYLPWIYAWSNDSRTPEFLAGKLDVFPTFLPDLAKCTLGWALLKGIELGVFEYDWRYSGLRLLKALRMCCSDEFTVPYGFQRGLFGSLSQYSSAELQLFANFACACARALGRRHEFLDDPQQESMSAWAQGVRDSVPCGVSLDSDKALARTGDPLVKFAVRNYYWDSMAYSLDDPFANPFCRELKTPVPDQELFALLSNVDTDLSYEHAAAYVTRMKGG